MVEKVVLPHLGSDRMLIDNYSILKAFGARLDWKAEMMAFSNNDVTVSTVQEKVHKFLHVQLWAQAQRKDISRLLCSTTNFVVPDTH